MIALPTAAQIEKLSPNGVSNWIESLQSGSLNYPVEQTARALAALYNRQQQYLELTQSASAKFTEQQAAISGATADIQAQAKQAEAELADARAARKLVEEAQAETVAEIQAVGIALDQMAVARQALLDELNRMLDAATKSAYKIPPAPVDSDFKAELDAMFKPIFADFNQQKPQSSRSKSVQLQGLRQQPTAQPNYQPTYRPDYLYQHRIHRPTPEEEMASALSAIIVSMIFLLGAGGIVLSSWLSNRQALNAPVVEAEPPAIAQAAPMPAQTPQPQFYSPQLQAAVEQARALDAATRQQWISFCQQSSGAQGYGATEQQFCNAIKYL